MDTKNLPPGPFMLEQSQTTSANGGFHLYVVDRDVRKIAALWGKHEERLAMGELIVNARDEAEAVTRGGPEAEDHKFVVTNNDTDRALAWISALYHDAKDGDQTAAMICREFHEANKDR